MKENDDTAVKQRIDYSNILLSLKRADFSAVMIYFRLELFYGDKTELFQKSVEPADVGVLQRRGNPASCGSCTARDL
jgi:hypothetical protein